MAPPDDVKNFLSALHQVSGQIGRIELEARIARITLNDITTKLALDIRKPEGSAPRTSRKRR